MSDTDTSVLVVEDEEKLAETYTYWLQPEYTVYTAYTGEEALEFFQREDVDIDIVLLDRRLPGMSGGDVLAQLRDRSPDCYVAIITAVDPDYDILDMEFDEYITKPVYREDVLEIVENLESLDAYDEKMQASYRMASKIATLEEEKPRVELRDHEEYQQLKEGFLQVSQNIDASFANFSPGDFAHAYQELQGDGEIRDDDTRNGDVADRSEESEKPEEAQGRSGDRTDGE